MTKHILEGHLLIAGTYIQPVLCLFVTKQLKSTPWPQRQQSNSCSLQNSFKTGYDYTEVGIPVPQSPPKVTQSHTLLGCLMLLFITCKNTTISVCRYLLLHCKSHSSKHWRPDRQRKELTCLCPESQGHDPRGCLIHRNPPQGLFYKSSRALQVTDQSWWKH